MLATILNRWLRLRPKVQSVLQLAVLTKHTRRGMLHHVEVGSRASQTQMLGTPLRNTSLHQGNPGEWRRRQANKHAVPFAANTCRLQASRYAPVLLMATHVGAAQDMLQSRSAACAAR